MTDSEINIAIATACGWSDIAIRISYSDDPFDPEMTPQGKHPSFGIEIYFAIPDYRGSLDAMAVAENTLAGVDPYDYADELRKLCDTGDMDGKYFDCIFATAAQRAESFLRCKSLWKEGA